MMTIEDIKKKKKEFGYSNQQIAKKSGVPLGTVNKIFSGMTKVPRYETLLALEKVFRPVLTPEDPDSYAPKYAAPHPYQFARLHRDDSAIAEAAPAYAYSRKRDNDLPVEQVAERWPNQGNYTVEDYFNLPDDIRAELIDGRFYIMNAPSYPDHPVPMVLTNDFKKAVLTASALANEGDIVLLSPACASFDHFKNFEERGNTFKKIVMELL